MRAVRVLWQPRFGGWCYDRYLVVGLCTCDFLLFDDLARPGPCGSSLTKEKATARPPIKFSSHEFVRDDFFSMTIVITGHRKKKGVMRHAWRSTLSHKTNIQREEYNKNKVTIIFTFTLIGGYYVVSFQRPVLTSPKHRAGRAC